VSFRWSTRRFDRFLPGPWVQFTPRPPAAPWRRSRPVWTTVRRALVLVALAARPRVAVIVTLASLALVVAGLLGADL
jgi:hypothetical protein